jgi:hypothetical protein
MTSINGHNPVELRSGPRQGPEHEDLPVFAEQIIGILKEHETGVSVADLCRKHGVSDASIYKWKPDEREIVKARAPDHLLTAYMIARYAAYRSQSIVRAHSRPPRRVLRVRASNFH